MLAKRWAAGAGGAAQRPAPIAGVARYCMACLCLHGWARTARSQRELERAARAAFVYLYRTSAVYTVVLILESRASYVQKAKVTRACFVLENFVLQLMVILVAPRDLL